MIKVELTFDELRLLIESMKENQKSLLGLAQELSGRGPYYRAAAIALIESGDRVGARGEELLKVLEANVRDTSEVEPPCLP